MQNNHPSIKKSLDKSIVKNAALILRHVGMWVTSKPAVIRNPNFKAPEGYPDLAKGVAMYCVHGTADRASSFKLIADRILSRLPAVFSSIHLVDFSRRAQGESIEIFADQLLKQIVSNGDKHVVLAGHSRGGLVVAYFAEYLAKNAGIVVDGVIGISSPFDGAAIAMWPLTDLSSSVGEMRVGSGFVKSLSEKIDQSMIPYYYFSSTNDPLVATSSAFRHQSELAPVLFDRGGEVLILPPQKADAAHQQDPNLVLLDFHDHLSILSSHRLVGYLANFLDKVALRLVPDAMPAIEQCAMIDVDGSLFNEPGKQFKPNIS